MSETIIRNEITFEILKIRLIKRRDTEWFEITVLATDQYGSRETIVREGDVLIARLDTPERDN